jgi:predicted nucleotidyltransferase
MGGTDAPNAVLVEHLKAALTATPTVRLAVLFGSVAAGRQRTDSDLDIAVLPAESGFDASDEASLRRSLTRAAARDVDFIRIDQAPTLLLWQIATKGSPLFEATPGEFHRFQARAASEYLDYAPALAYNGEIFRRRLAESEILG